MVIKSEIIAIESLIPHPRNYNRHSDRQLSNLEQSLGEWGQYKNVVIDGKNRIIAGHGVVEAARRKGMTEIEVKRYSHLTEAESLSLLIADNEIARQADANNIALASLLEELRKTGDSVPGVDEEALEGILAEANRQATISKLQNNIAGRSQDSSDSDEDNQSPKRANIGDLWQLGNHRLFVGDCTKPGAVKKLLRDRQADLVFTSPPYAAQREYKLGEFDWLGLMNLCFDAITNIVTDKANIIINLGLVHQKRKVQFYWNDWLTHCEVMGYPLFGWYIWHKPSPIPGDHGGRLAPAFEFLFHFNKKRGVINKIIETKQEMSLSATMTRNKDGSVKTVHSPQKMAQAYKIPSSVISLNAEMGRGIHTKHPAVFPVALPAFIINTFSNIGAVVYEPFCGSGTSIIAAERTQRSCLAMEIEPTYADIAIERWQQETNLKAVLLE